MSFKIDKLLRSHLHEAPKYQSARDDFKGSAKVFMDANENPYESEYNRYPDPLATNLRKRLAKEKTLAPEQIALGNGSDEWIDLLIRLFAEPGINKILSLEPSYGMYRVSAALNKVAFLELALNEDWDIELDSVFKALAEENVSLIFLCSPNNPTGNLLNQASIEKILKSTSALVIIDEAYFHFSDTESWTTRLAEFPNLVVLQTFSKAMGLAALRIGIIYGHPDLIALLLAYKPPYNLNGFSQKKALEYLDSEIWKQQVEEIIKERNYLSKCLAELTCVEKVFPSKANFLMVKFKDGSRVFNYLKSAGFVLRDRSKQVSNCLRISIGTPQQNRELLKLLAAYEN